MLLGGRYDADGNVARGGMSEVHFGTDLHLDRKVVLKCLQPYQDQRRIVDEQKALLQVISKHVVRLLDVLSQADNGVTKNYLVLEYIDGEDLKECQFDCNDHYLRTLWQLAAGLRDIHAFGIIHRDIKPGNIRVDIEGVVKLFDFGLAREDGVDNKTRGAVGTYMYMAPELFKNKTVRFSPSADVYSFAVTALNLLNRQRPDFCMHRPPLAAPADAVDLHVPELNPSIKAVLQRCLDQNPDQRPDMGEVTQTIEDVILYDQHSARLILSSNIIDLNKDKRTSFPSVVNPANNEKISGIRIEYDGSGFQVMENVGNVRVNNIIAAVGTRLTPSCVIEFPTTNTRPYYATFNVSQPEVFV